MYFRDSDGDEFEVSAVYDDEGNSAATETDQVKFMGLGGTGKYENISYVNIKYDNDTVIEKGEGSKRLREVKVYGKPVPVRVQVMNITKEQWNALNLLNKSSPFNGDCELCLIGDAETVKEDTSYIGELIKNEKVKHYSKNVKGKALGFKNYKSLLKIFKMLLIL